MRLVIVLSALPLLFGCPDGSGADAGVDGGPELPEGVSECEDGRWCLVGTHCEDDTCEAGCFVDAQCRDDESCEGLSETSIGRCTPDRAPVCGNATCDLGEDETNCDVDCAVCGTAGTGATNCGDVTCDAGFHCLDPATSTCEIGCLSQSHCECGTGCVFGLTASPIGTCTNPFGTPPTCGDGSCNGNEGPGTCPDDCGTWADQCSTACSLLSEASCFDADQEAFECQQNCANVSEEVAQAFAACVGMAGAQSCPTSCTDVFVP